ncbi:MAG: hypothetical protein WCS99_12275 [Limisphaerales bacterium]
MNGDLLTDEERNTSMGLGYVMAAERLGLKYLADIKVMTELVCDMTNRAMAVWSEEQARDENFEPSPSYGEQLDKMVEELAVILRGRNPRFMATPWFTDPNQLRESLWCEYRSAFPDDPEVASPAYDPIWQQASCCVVVPYDMLDWHTKEGTLHEFPVENSAHVRCMVASFLGLPLESLPPDLVKSEAEIRALRAGDDESETGGEKCG